MGGGIEGSNLQTSRSTDHLVATNNDRTEWLLANRGAELGLFDGHRHEPFMIRHSKHLSARVVGVPFRNIDSLH
jgi:hypothetical protein